MAHAWRGWLGPYLLDALVSAARDRGVPGLEADVLVTNQPMLALLRSRGCATMDHPRLVRGAGRHRHGWSRPHLAGAPRPSEGAGGGPRRPVARGGRRPGGRSAGAGVRRPVRPPLPLSRRGRPALPVGGRGGRHRDLATSGPAGVAGPDRGPCRPPPGCPGLCRGGAGLVRGGARPGRGGGDRPSAPWWRSSNGSPGALIPRWPPPARGPVAADAGAGAVRDDRR